MKHVFSVTSNLTFSLVRRIVKVNALSASDCVLLLLRGYKIPVEMERTYAHRVETTYNVDVDNGRVFAGARFWRTQKNIGEFDRLVDAEVGGEDFVFYTSVCSNDICSLMVTKPNCKGFYMIEDGLSSYRDFNPQTFTGIRYWVYRLLLKPLWPRIFEVKNHFIEDGRGGLSFGQADSFHPVIFLSEFYFRYATFSTGISHCHTIRRGAVD